MIPLAYTIPMALQSGVASGTVKLFGAILKDATTGKVLGHVQPTQNFDQFIASASHQLGAAASHAFPPLDMALSAANTVQNQMILGKLAEMSSTLGIIQTLQFASLAVSGLGLGISVANLAVLQKGFKRIENNLERLGEAVERVTYERRRDDVRHDMNQLRIHVDAVISLEDRNEKDHPGHAAQQALAALAGRFETHLLIHVDDIRNSMVEDTDLELILSLAAAIRLCHDMGTRALFWLDDLGGAATLTARQASRFTELVDKLPPPDALARLAASGVEDRTIATENRARFLPLAKNMRTGLHETAASVMSQSTLSRQLLDQDIRGPDYLEAIKSHDEAPLLFLPVADNR